MLEGERERDMLLFSFDGGGMECRSWSLVIDPVERVWLRAEDPGV